MYMFAALSAKRQRDVAQFSLERDVYQQRMARAWVMSVLFLLLGGVIFAVNMFISPLLPPLPTPTPQAVGLQTPTPTAINLTTPLAATSVPTAQVVMEAESVVNATPTTEIVPTETPQEQFQPDCPSPNAQLTLPVAGSNVSGLVSVEGTAKINTFSYYKFEVQFPGSDTPNFVSQYSIPVENGVLGTWDVSNVTDYPPGIYRFRLVVVDIYGNTKLCTIPVNVVSTSE